MKKILILATSITFAIGVSSCKKKYDCDCTYGINTSVGTLDATHSEEIKVKDESEGQSECDAIKSNLASYEDNTNISCSLVEK